MRPHVELIDEKDLIWHPAELPHGSGEARQRNLCYDEENGAASLLVEFVTDWRRGAGLHAAQTEWYVLEGRIRIGGHEMGEGGYWVAPRGVGTPAMSAEAGTRILLFREYADWAFAPAGGGDAVSGRGGGVSGDGAGVSGDGGGVSGNGADVPGKDAGASGDGLVIMDSNAMEWYDVVHPEHGSPMDFERGGTPVPGLFIKLLWRDPENGFYTRLIKAKPGWREHPLAHHPVYEEAYCLDGDFHYNFGTMVKGQYFFRPAGVRHGDFTAGEENGCVWLLRCDGDLVDWYTDNASVEMKGDPVNWGDGYPDTEPPVYLQPVRSRSIGPWKDPSYV